MHHWGMTTAMSISPCVPLHRRVTIRKTLMSGIVSLPLLRRLLPLKLKRVTAASQANAKAKASQASDKAEAEPATATATSSPASAGPQTVVGEAKKLKIADLTREQKLELLKARLKELKMMQSYQVFRKDDRKWSRGMGPRPLTLK